MEEQNDIAWFSMGYEISTGSPALLLCEREDIHIVPFVDGETPYEKYQLPIRKDLMLVKGVVPETPRPLVGMDWLQTITELVESSLVRIMQDEDGDPYADWLDCFSNGADAFLIGALYEGPSGLCVNASKRLSLESSRSDSIVGEEEIVEEDNNPEVWNAKSTLSAAIGIIGYWLRQGVELHCPLAKLFAVLTDIGFFSMLPMFNLADLEKARPVWKECLEDYGNRDDRLIGLIEGFIFKDDGKLTTDEEKQVSSSAGLLFAILKEELIKYKELHNAAEEG
jgi:hypothetical protein